VLGYSIEEIVEILGGTIPAIKGTLRRGRIQLRALAEAPLPALAEADRLRLAIHIYIDSISTASTCETSTPSGLLDWVDGKVAGIRDFMFARYAMEGAEISLGPK